MLYRCIAQNPPYEISHREDSLFYKVLPKHREFFYVVAGFIRKAHRTAWHPESARHQWH